MPQAQRFHIGDRVITRVAMRGVRQDLPQGALGTVVRVFGGLDDFYDVRFDAHATMRLIAGDLLDAAPRAQQHGHDAL
jgi:hypothetical protein